MPQFTRRDFLKAVAAAPAAYGVSRLFRRAFPRAGTPADGRPNIIVLVFDAMSAANLSLYGYHRRTTPNFERFAQRASIYHSHYSTANFTVPGVASLLTGLHPWTHRALNLSGLVARSLASRNIFELLDSSYHRMAFGQNVMAANLLNQFRGQIDSWLPPGAFSEVSLLPSDLFARDPNAAYGSLDHLMFDYVDAPGSLIFGLSQRVAFERLKKFNRNYPRGLPQPHEYPIIYKLPNVFDGLLHTLEVLPDPYFSYIHIFSPHAPYNARKDFIGIFDDGWKQVRKPESAFSEGETYETTEQNRVWYDEYIANVDAEFGRFLDYLQNNGTLDRSYLVVTADHGELLERGVKGHVSPLLYEPLVRVPLLISAPGQARAQEFHSPTSSVDLLPSLLSVTGHAVPEWAEGQLLPGLGGEEIAERPVFMLEAKSSSAFRKLPQATFAIRRGSYKITLYRGYDAYGGQDAFELYDVQADPEEMNNLIEKEPSLAAAMRSEVLARFDELNQMPHGG